MRGIEFGVIWFDQDVIEYRVSCSNGSFSGTTRLYCSHQDMARTADILSGFPSSITDYRHVRLGTFQSNFAGGGVDMSFRCVDSSGHALVLVELRDDDGNSRGELQSVRLCIPIEAGAIDSFVAQARSIDDTMGSKAYLAMADHHVR